MKSDLTQEQIESYQDNGFVVIDGFLDADELESWRSAVADGVENRGAKKVANREDYPESDEYYSKIFLQRVNLWMDSEPVRKLMLDERLGRMATELTGADGMRIWHDQALIKQAWGNPTAWHLDCPYWSFHHPNAISIWVALDDVTVQNGGLFFLPGSHKDAEFERNVSITDNIGGLFEAYPEWKHREPVAAPMKAGSCSFHSGLTAHGAAANFTPRARRAMTCAYMPDGATYVGKQNVLPSEYFKTLKIGDVLDNDAQNPLLYRRS
ncbi:MAG: phytanoyl-CoA dioxygenase family protein [Lentisphaerae bacterium]|nr:phytanoyl-CoA dioxygenase family protein [Lentisphaerota bacterium]